MKSRKRCAGLKENVRRAEGEAPLLERRKKPRYFRPPGAATLWLDKSTTRAVEIGIIALSVLPSLSFLLSPLIRASQARGAIDEGVISPSFLFIVIKCFSYAFSYDHQLLLLIFAFLYLNSRQIAFVTMIWFFMQKMRI